MPGNPCESWWIFHFFCSLVIGNHSHLFSHAPATSSFIKWLIVGFDSHIFRCQCQHPGSRSGHAIADRFSRGSSGLCRISSGKRGRSKCGLQPWLASACHSCCCRIWTCWVLICHFWIIKDGFFVSETLVVVIEIIQRFLVFRNTFTSFHLCKCHSYLSKYLFSFLFFP